MRFTNFDLPKNNEVYKERTITKFLWWPKCFNGECRWLERADIVQVASYEETLKSSIVGSDLSWIDKGFKKD